MAGCPGRARPPGCSPGAGGAAARARRRRRPSAAPRSAASAAAGRRRRRPLTAATRTAESTDDPTTTRTRADDHDDHVDADAVAEPDTHGPVGRLVDGNRCSSSATRSWRRRRPLRRRACATGSCPWAGRSRSTPRPDGGSGSAAQVLDRRLGAGWDAAVDHARQQLRRRRRGASPTSSRRARRAGAAARRAAVGDRVRDDRAEVNYVLARAGAQRDNVRVVEWAGRTADDDGELLGGDGLHLSDDGRASWCDDVEASVGRRPDPRATACRPYTDDSMARRTAAAPDGLGSSEDRRSVLSKRRDAGSARADARPAGTARRRRAGTAPDPSGPPRRPRRRRRAL